ncbi:TPA: hypothetical protein NHR53_006102 [Pseudomonas aeruginosa]|uniref:hypothetical protein n=1 Tax=Pseudomonas aeruginosa TaxID=287 RepID=UPI001585E03A|nr:hypothetical protein [Pseudomonas aeruginosa]HCE7248177.1 hypothetical protein [Pseudomonas aeruginosa]HCE8129507.1 hypothetical protein [Pseudomonas aeruginosa]HCF0447619.1 hypothetical protein [Pseudomonas aeruginosa]
MSKEEREGLIAYHEATAKDHERQLARTGAASLRSYISHHRQEARRLRETQE